MTATAWIEPAAELAIQPAIPRHAPLRHAEPRPAPLRPAARDEGERIAAMLDTIAASMPVQQRVVHAGDLVCRAGDSARQLVVLLSGCCKIVDAAADGRAQVVGLAFRGDWLGIDGLADGRYRCDAVALDTGCVWTLRYDLLLAACAREPRLNALLHAEMSRIIGRDHDTRLALTTLPADARVAEFLRRTAEALSARGLRTDRITLRLTRAEIGAALGMTLESASRALSRLARAGAIAFADGARRELVISDPAALARFAVDGTAVPARTLQ